MSRSGLSPAQNERLRKLIEQARQDLGLTQEEIAPKVGFSTQSGLSSFLSGRSGTTYSTARAVAKLLKIPEWDALGEPPPDIATMPARELAALLARQIGVSEEAIDAVLEEPITPDRDGWYALVWADEMRVRHLQLVRDVGTRSPAKKRR